MNIEILERLVKAHASLAHDMTLFTDPSSRSICYELTQSKEALKSIADAIRREMTGVPQQ